MPGCKERTTILQWNISSPCSSTVNDHHMLLSWFQPLASFSKLTHTFCLFTFFSAHVALRLPTAKGGLGGNHPSLKHLVYSSNQLISAIQYRQSTFLGPCEGGSSLRRTFSVNKEVLVAGVKHFLHPSTPHCPLLMLLCQNSFGAFMLYVTDMASSCLIKLNYIKSCRV